MWTIKRWQYICDHHHISGKSWWIKFIMHSLNITRCIKLNDRPDGIKSTGLRSGEFCGHMSGAMVCHSATCVWDQSSWHRWAVTASYYTCLAWLGAAADWWRSWPMANTLACMYSCQWRTFWTNFVTTNFLCTWWTFTPCLMQRVIFKECIIKVWNVMFSFSLGSVSTLFRWDGNFCHICACKTFFPA